MEYRKLGHSGLHVPALSFGTGTFGGSNEFFRKCGMSTLWVSYSLLRRHHSLTVELITQFIGGFWYESHRNQRKSQKKVEHSNIA